MNDGGSAFPTEKYMYSLSKTDKEDTGHWIPSAGMTLRDYFAAKALLGMIILPDSHGSYSQFADEAYKYADAMIAERDKANPT